MPFCSWDDLTNHVFMEWFHFAKPHCRCSSKALLQVCSKGIDPASHEQNNSSVERCLGCICSKHLRDELQVSSRKLAKFDIRNGYSRPGSNALMVCRSVTTRYLVRHNIERVKLTCMPLKNCTPSEDVTVHVEYRGS